MVASSKTFDLFGPVPDTVPAVAPESAQRLRERSKRSSRPALEIAKPVGPPPEALPEHNALWLAISLPRLPLEALLRQSTEPSAAMMQAAPDAVFPNLTREVKGGSRPNKQPAPTPTASRSTRVHRGTHSPTVIVDLSHNQQRVVACNPAAVQAGITLGIGLNTAYALTDALQVLARDPSAEQRFIETIAQWAGCFTSKVTLEAPDAVLLEIKGSLKLFGGLESLRALIAKGLEGKGVQAVLSVAPTPLAALAFSRTGQPFVCTRREQLPGALSDIPILTLRWPEETLAVLQSMGVQKIGDCLRLPREGFARRFGPQLLLQLDQLLGRVAQPQRPFIARERFTTRQDFELDLDGHEALLLHVQPLLQALEAFLQPRQSGVQSLELHLRHRDRPPTRVVLRFLRPMADAAHAHSMLTERLERLELPAPVIAARLRSGPLWPLEMETIAHRLLNDPQRTAPQVLTRLIERLRARLGDESVQGLQCVAEHRPELASRRSEPIVHAKRRKAHRSMHAATTALPRPFWLLPEPQSLTTQKSWPQFEGRLELLQGPERIESGWWDGNDVCRDYYLAATPQGLRVWIYRERKSKRWFLQGIYG